MKIGDKVNVKHPNTNKIHDLDFTGIVVDIDSKGVTINDTNNIQRVCNKDVFKITTSGSKKIEDESEGDAE